MNFFILFLISRKILKFYRLKLGPNGAILTCLNLFTIHFDEVLSLLESHQELEFVYLKNNNNKLLFFIIIIRYIIIDTPGQIEAFTWSASGQIITDLLASSYPTFIAYVVDIPRSKQPATFMSNMLYACSVMYKTRLPLVTLLNKNDVESSEEIEKWMKDYEEFQDALRSNDA